jgi:hypothetical protein
MTLSFSLFSLDALREIKSPRLGKNIPVCSACACNSRKFLQIFSHIFTGRKEVE